jgi:N,N'-diacetyllegionaminate synthase
MNHKTFIIAEAGVNHNGSIDIAKQLIEAAKDADVNAVKFQTFRAEHFVSISALKAEYQKNYTIESESQLEMLKKLELDVNSHRMLIEYCRKKNIEFLSSPFDLESVDLLYELGLETFKIPSGEITNLPYLRKIGKLKKKIILSTGMANLEEIENALNVLVNTGTPKEIITVLHCNTEYPTALEDVNLLAMLTMKTELDVEVGYSDHTLGIEIPIAAVALGASVIEKHFTLDKNMEGPDHKASLDPDELKQMVRAIRLIEKAMGDGIKKSSQSEQKNKPVVRKSIVAVKDISKGEVFTEENITTKRPGIGISPMMWDEVIGQRANKDYKQDDLI